MEQRAIGASCMLQLIATFLKILEGCCTVWNGISNVKMYHIIMPIPYDENRLYNNDDTLYKDTKYNNAK